VGTESNISVRGGSPRVESPDEGPFDEDQAEDAQDRMRRRLQQLPRGLRRQQEEDQQEDNAPPAGIDLVPNSNQDRGFGRDDEPEDEPEPQEEEPPRSGTLERVPLTQPGEALDKDAEIARSGRAKPSLGSSDDAIAELALLTSTSPAPILAVQSEVEEAPVVLRLSPSAVKVDDNDTFEVKLRVASREDIAHVPVTLAYDPQVIQFVSAVNGGFLGQQAQVLSDASEPGRLVVGASRMGDVGGVRGDGDVVRLQFKALRDGETSLRFEKIEVLDDKLARLKATFRDSLVIVGQPGEGAGPGRPVGLRADNRRLDASDLEGIDLSDEALLAPAVETVALEADDRPVVEIEKAAPSNDVIADLLEDERRLERPEKDFVTPELLAAVLDQMKQSTDTESSQRQRQD
jgi:hypothetical protein